MDRVEQLLKKVEETRTYMNDLIREKSDLLDSEVIIASQMLDSILDEYYKILQQENIRK
ncbi:aspartyl-phosphate phosphatase Spo0E family protein [Clostridium sp. JS66]|uniref:aspartyl-phosphate phosphatase Spo0E family protein n=1 Tax=Clostridium sp. JS66 TaxID=3064705 RepID=UPI00298D9426|nr:aspartyl-phosphate phosphatase Spo0E family protein [Clostridium sp. JS66]WPC40496.1 aspartyl-phosphate phosphatase Spo0E family protein [Clostridium sp. JS66]